MEAPPTESEPLPAPVHHSLLPWAPAVAALLIAVLALALSLAGSPLYDLAFAGILAASAHAGVLIGSRRTSLLQHDGPSAPIVLSWTNVARVLAGIAVALAVLAALMWASRPGLMLRLGDSITPWLPWPSLHHRGEAGMALYAALAVIACACPWAFALAAPSALRAGMQAAMARGILPRDQSALASLKDIAIVVFDKTGTLTQGLPRVTNVEPAPGVTAEELLQAAASAEAQSMHPIAAALAEQARRERIVPLEVEGFIETHGRGVRAILNDTAVMVGKAAWLREQGLNITPLEHRLYELHHEAKTILVVARGRHVLGIIALQDSLKKDSVRAIKILKRMNIRCIMITGDSAASARIVAEQMGITEVKADLLPHEKAGFVGRMNKETIRKLAMAGEGSDDAEALEAADIGIAIGAAVESHMPAADVRIVSPELLSLVTAIQLARATHGKLLQGISISIAYHLVAVPVAMSGLIHPVLAALLMPGVACAVALNARPLHRFDPAKYSAEVMRR